MTNVLRFISISALVLAGEVTLYAAGALPPKEPGQKEVRISLAEAIERVKEHHPDLALQQLAVARAREEVMLATRAFLPDIDADYIASSAAGGFGLIMTAARLLKPVFSLKSLLADKQIKRLLHDRENVMLQVQDLEVTQDVKELYVSLLIQTRVIRVLDENASRARKRQELKEALYKEGRITHEELLRQKTDFEKALAESEKAGVYLARSESAFKTLLGLESDKPSLESPAGESSFSLTLEDCFDLAYRKNPLLKALFLLEEASEKERGKWKSKFVVDGLFVGLGESGGGLFSGRARLGATGSVSLYDWGKTGIRNRIRDLDHERLLLEHEKRFEDLRNSISENYAGLKALESEKNAAKAELESAGESLRQKQLYVEAGRTRQEELLQAETESSLEELNFWQKSLEAWLVRERLLKNLGISGMSELREALPS